MNFDVRLPIGLLFLGIGALVAAWGAFGGPSAVRPGEPNIDLIWGAAMALFGAVMMGLVWLARRGDLPPPDA
ncbi:hypothetical protein [Phenylobacterium sp.]|jgi:hypothetical protein|uniref:hypothetical protein n=1 Tax=Phenylobacterium sp. TaxID=1871053 RepID=UPI002F3F190B